MLLRDNEKKGVKYIMRYILISLVILFLLPLCACAGTESSQVERDVPHYTADQVIYVARAAAPECVPAKLATSWDVEYFSHGKWSVTQTCYVAYGYGVDQRKVYSTRQYYFYEDTGKLVQR